MDHEIKRLRAKYKAAPVQFNTVPVYGPGRRRRIMPGEEGYASTDGRWYVRQLNSGTMLLVDEKKATQHYVRGGMPEVQAKITELLAVEGK